MNRDEGSPLQNLIQTPTTPDGVIKDNSILRMFENSLSDGVLYRFRGTDGNEPDIDSMLDILRAFWGAVNAVFKEAWALSAKRSRLMHGAGIISMGFVMDAIAERYRSKGLPGTAGFRGGSSSAKEYLPVD